MKERAVQSASEQSTAEGLVWVPQGLRRTAYFMALSGKGKQALETTPELGEVTAEQLKAKRLQFSTLAAQWNHGDNEKNSCLDPTPGIG